ncbi:hypothetical protein [Marinimicrobium sp. C2-29]|uniref:hypothetical protein n=1 Tax=Marinimicrobium sp. C2-29 TaxID=3139825 RepID=UPI003139ADAB
MQKVTKILIPLVVVGVVVAAIAAGVFTQKGASSSAGLDDFLTHIPADTPVLMVGHTSAENIESMDAMLRNMNPQDLQPFYDLLAESEEGSGARLLQWLLDDYIQTGVAGGYEGLSERYGFDFTAPYGIYLNGAAPVVRFSLSESAPLKSVLAEAAAETGVTAEEAALGSATLYSWELSADKPELKLGLAVDESSMTLSLMMDSDSNEARMRRFARQPVEQPLAGSERVKELRADYAEADQFMGFLDFHRIAEALLLPEQNSTGRELRGWFPEMEQAMGSNLTDACRQDYVGLAASMPRLTMGAEAYSLDSDTLHQTLGFLWQIDNEPVLSSLKKLQGFVPAYAREADDKLLAFALGVDVSQLVPVLTDLWTQFTNASFACAELKQLQQQAQALNPGMLAMGTAMFESVRGAGVAVFDLAPSDQTPMGLDGSVLVSLSSQNPAAIASMLTSFVPQLGGLQIPQDGTAVEIPDPMGLGGNYIAIKGKHLVIYRGEAAKAQAEALAGEALEVSGLSALSLNLSEPKELFQLIEPMTAQSATGGCTPMYAGLLSLTKSPMVMTYNEHFSDRGWKGTLDMDMTLIDVMESATLAGDYQIDTLDDADCQWYTIGTETLNSDGTGQFAGENASFDCDTYRAEFNWELTGSLMEQTGGTESERAACDSDWETADSDTEFDCGVLALDNTGFYCMSQADGEMELFRYIRQ